MDPAAKAAFRFGEELGDMAFAIKICLLKR